jgi:chromosome segregation ATPase
LNAGRIEAHIWRKLETYVRHPNEALDELATRMRGQADAASTVRAKLAEKQQEQTGLQGERDVVWTKYRKGEMTEKDADHQIALIAKEEIELTTAITKLTEQLGEADAVSAKLDAAAAVLRDLRGKLDAGPLTFATRRNIVDKLVRRIVVKTELDEKTLRPRAGIYPETYFDSEDDDLTAGERAGILDSTAGPFVVGQAG